MKESNAKSGESIKKLNEGLNLIEQQNDERGRQFEKIISAEIKQRFFSPFFQIEEMKNDFFKISLKRISN